MCQIYVTIFSSEIEKSMKQPEIFGLLELRTKFSFRCHSGKPTIGGDSYNCIDVGSGRAPKSTNASQTHSQLSFEYRLVGIRNGITNTSARKSAITIVIKTTGLLEFRKCMSHAFLQLTAFMESSVCVCVYAFTSVHQSGANGRNG